MKEIKGRRMQSVNEALAFADDFPFSIRHFSFFIFYSSSFILHPSSWRSPSFILS